MYACVHMSYAKQGTQMHDCRKLTYFTDSRDTFLRIAGYTCIHMVYAKHGILTQRLYFSSGIHKCLSLQLVLLSCMCVCMLQ